MRFDGMKLSQEGLETITPTDIDALIDVRDKVLILFEVKLKGKDVPTGQRIALERMVNDAKKAGKDAIVIVADHDVSDPEQDVYLKDLTAREVFETEFMEWRSVNRQMTAKQLADYFINRHYKAS